MNLTTKPSVNIHLLLHKSIVGICMMVFSIFSSHTATAGGACAVAKELGNSLAVEWVAQEGETVTSAVRKAKELLQEKGFTKKKLRDLHIQASTNMRRGYMVIIKSSFKTVRGKNRTSYGCGFSPISSTDAEVIAVKNLSSYSWGWKSEFGYELHARHEF